jgi:hypothetical protein
MTFRVGQTVECVDDNDCWDDGEGRSILPQIRSGNRYIVRWIGINGDTENLSVRLHGISRQNSFYPDYPFRASRFRPIVENKTSISFTTGADPKSKRFDNRRKSRERV